MAAIVSVVDGVTNILATHVNQYAATLSNIFGITDTAQANLGRLPLPWLGADPAIANGLIWMRSDLGSNGELRVRHNGVTKTHIPTNQIVQAQMTHATPFSIGNTYADITNLTTGAINWTGTRLKVSLVAGDYGVDASAAYVYLQTNAYHINGGVNVQIRVVIDAVTYTAFLAGFTLNLGGGATGLPNPFIGLPGLIGVYTITPGVHTVKVQIMWTSGTPGAIGCNIYNAALIVEDID